MNPSLHNKFESGIILTIVLLALAVGLDGVKFTNAQSVTDPPGGVGGTGPQGGMQAPPDYGNPSATAPGGMGQNTGVPSMAEQSGGQYPEGARTMPPTGQGGTPGGAGLEAYGLPGGAGQRSVPQAPQAMQGAADQQPSLGTGGQQSPLSVSDVRDDVANLKSVRDASHPLNDFLAVVKRPIADAEKEVYLHEILSGVTSPAHRRELLKAYWNLSEKMMHCHVRLAQRQRLEHAFGKLQTNKVTADEIDSAYQLVSQQFQALELEFIQAQYRFLDLQSRIPAASLRWRAGYADAENGWQECDDMISQFPAEWTAQKPENRPLPVPADFPLAVPYNTKVEELKKQRTLSQNSLLLDRTIPLQYKAIDARKEARKIANRQWTTTLDYQQSPVAQIEVLAREEMALISAIIEYNHQVDEFVLETFGTNIPERQLLASILVLPKPPTTGTQQSPNRMPSTFSRPPNDHIGP